MRSRAARLLLSSLACLALVAVAYVLFNIEHQLGLRRAMLRAFDLHAREAISQLTDARAGQQAYLAAGQSTAFWVPKVATFTQEAAASLDSLRGLANESDVKKTLLDVSASVTEFSNIDKRAREYLRADQTLMAGDVVFSEGAPTAADAAAQIEGARMAERQAFDVYEGQQHRLEGYALAAAAGALLLIVGVLAMAPHDHQHEEENGVAPVETWAGRTITEIAAPVAQPEKERSVDRSLEAGRTLKTAAEICTELGRVDDMTALRELVGRAAAAMEASGLIVWLGNAAGGDLRPIVTHGYSDQVVSLMRPVPRSADNAAAAAYRSGSMQVVPGRLGSSLGAVVAPLMAADGCIGALTAEIRNGREASESIQALATIVAAQLATVLAPSAAQTVETPSIRAAGA